EHPHRCVRPPCRRQRPDPGEHLPTMQLLLLDTDQVGRHAAPRLGQVHAPVVLLESPDADAPVRRTKLDLLPHLQRAVYQGAGDDGAEAADREHPVDRQPRPPPLPPGSLPPGGCRRHTLPPPLPPPPPPARPPPIPAGSRRLAARSWTASLRARL